MTPAEQRPDPLRSAALLLHALTREDRAWMLAALPNGQKESLVPLLDELESLGIPGDPTWIESREDAAASQWPEELEANEVSVLCHVLAGEPSGVARVLLAMQAWPWAPQLLARIGGQQPALPGYQSAPRLEQALLAALKSRCDVVSAFSVPSEPPGRWERLKARFGRRRP